MGLHAEAVLETDLFQRGADFGAYEFGERTAAFANHVVVLRVAVRVFVDGSIVCAGDFANESRFFQRCDGSVNRRAADFFAVGPG